MINFLRKEICITKGVWLWLCTCITHLPGFYGVTRDCALGDPAGGGGVSGSWTTSSPHLEHMLLLFLNLNPTFIYLKQNQISRFLSNGDF